LQRLHAGVMWICRPWSGRVSLSQQVATREAGRRRVTKKAAKRGLF
jgi:hypothetical protein